MECAPEIIQHKRAGVTPITRSEGVLPQPVISLIDFLCHIFPGLVHKFHLRKIHREITVVLLRDSIEQIVVVIGKAGIGLELADAVPLHDGGDGDTVKCQTFVAAQILHRPLRTV